MATNPPKPVVSVAIRWQHYSPFSLRLRHFVRKACCLLFKLAVRCSPQADCQQSAVGGRQMADGGCGGAKANGLRIAD